jgi:hypothetical protein
MYYDFTTASLTFEKARETFLKVFPHLNLLMVPVGSVKNCKQSFGPKK